LGNIKISEDCRGYNRRPEDTRETRGYQKMPEVAKGRHRISEVAKEPQKGARNG
jgi:hypothetical protein